MADYVFEFVANIESIDLSHNEINNDGINKYAFERCNSLKKLDLSNNQLLNIPFDRNWLVPLKNLEEINLNDEDNFENCQDRFQFVISDYYHNTNLVLLFARSGRCGSHINFKNNELNHFPKLKNLVFTGYAEDKNAQTNGEKYNRFNFETNLTILDVSGRGSQTLTISKHFKIIIADYNAIQFIRVYGSSTNNVVTEIYASHNQLTDIEFVEYCPNLEIIDLSSNNLETINEERLMSLVNLREFYCANNKLQRLDLGFMQQLPSLNVLDISQNNLNGLFEIDSNLTVDITINIRGNYYSKINFGTNAILL